MFQYGGIGKTWGRWVWFEREITSFGQAGPAITPGYETDVENKEDRK